MPPAKVRKSFYERPSRYPYLLYGTVNGDNTNGLQSSMGLEHNTATFKKYTTIMGKCAHECFPEALPLGQQPPEKVKLYMENVNKALPILQKYDQSWPASAYVRIWSKRQVKLEGLRKTRARSSEIPLSRVAKKTRGNADSKQKHAARTPVQVIEVSDSSPAPTSPAAGRNPERASPAETAPRTFARNAAPSRTISMASVSPARSATMVSTAHNSRHATHPSHKSSEPGRRTTPAAAAAADGGAPGGGSIAPVREFLRSLTQPLDALLPAFRAIGIRDAESLRSVVRMEGWYQWLYMVLVMAERWEVTELQWKHLADGLKRLAAEEGP